MELDQRYQKYCDERAKRQKLRDEQLEAQRQQRVRDLMNSVPHIKTAAQLKAPTFTEGAEQPARLRAAETLQYKNN